MTLEQVIQNLSSLPEDQTIYAARPWNQTSAALVALEPDDHSLPAEAQKFGCSYFLEVAIANDFMEEWIGHLGTEPDISKKCDRLITYAEKDA